MSVSTAVADVETLVANTCVSVANVVRQHKTGLSMRTAMLWVRYPEQSNLPLLQEAVDAFSGVDVLLPTTVRGAAMVVRDIHNNWFFTCGNDAARLLLAEAVRFGFIEVKGHLGHEVFTLHEHMLRWGAVDLSQDSVEFGGARYELVTLLPGTQSPPMPVVTTPTTGLRKATDEEVLREMHEAVRSYGEGKGYTNGELHTLADGTTCYDRHVLIKKERVWTDVERRLKTRGLKPPYKFETFDAYTKRSREHELLSPYKSYRLVFAADTTTRVGGRRR